MTQKQAEFYPFYDPYREGDTLTYGSKAGISLGIGALYLLFQYYSLQDKAVFFPQYCWILGIIISTATMALYLATDVFRRSLAVMREIETSQTSSVDREVSLTVISEWVSDTRYLLAGIGFATANTTVAHLLGVPTEFHESVFSLVMMYTGFFLAGFTCGMGMLGIIIVIVLYLEFAPTLKDSLDPNNPDGTGGIKKLGDSLWIFAGLIGSVAILVAIYLFGVSWVYAYKGYVQVIFIFWVGLPFIVAISVVLIPGLAVRRQVSSFKQHKSKQLKQEKSKLYSDYKNFDVDEDEVIIAEKRELSERLMKIQDELDNIRAMRNSHIDGKDKD